MGQIEDLRKQVAEAEAREAEARQRDEREFNEWRQQRETQSEIEQLQARLSQLQGSQPSLPMSHNGVPIPPSGYSQSALSGEEIEKARWRTIARDNYLRQTMMDPVDAQRAFATFFRDSWNAHMQKRARLHKLIGE